MTDERLDLAVVGAGIAGASVAYFAASAGAGVLLLERESHPGMHSTGRSAAMFMESYGSPQVRALTRASRAFLMQPPAGFTATPLLRPRGALYVGHAGQHDDLQALFDALRSEGCPCEWLDADQARARVPVLLPEAAAFAVFDPLAADLDVHALHQGFLRGARAHGATLHCDADVVSLERDHEGWELVDATGRRWRARRVVNAAGAWADEFAIRARVAPLGVQPRRRSAFVFDPPPGLHIDDWPCVAGVDESFYFKPDAGLLLGSPANADPVPAHDVVPEELDIALGIDRIERATTLRIRRPRRTWAGLRSFVADGDLVGGFDAVAPGFFWMAALGGYGIQTSPAMGQACAARLLDHPWPTALSAQGLTPAGLDPRRLGPGLERVLQSAGAPAASITP